MAHRRVNSPNQLNPNKGEKTEGVVQTETP